MGQHRSLRQKQRVTLVVFLAAMIVAVPLLGPAIPLRPVLSVSPTTVPAAAAPTETAATTGSVPSGTSVFDFEIPALTDTTGLANRGGDLLSLAVSEHVETMARNVQSAQPVFVDVDLTAYVKINAAAVYAKPDADAPHVIAFRFGDAVTVTGTTTGWLRVRFQDGEMYMRPADTSFEAVYVPAEGLRYVQSVEESELKLLAAPSLDAEVLTDIWYADRVTALESSPEWTKIRTEGGYEGYVPSSILTTDIVFVQSSDVMYCIEELAAYAATDTASEILEYYDEDESVQLTGYSFDWVQVVTPDDEIAYIPMEKLTDASPYSYSAPSYYTPPQTSWPSYSYSNADIQTVIDTAMSYVGCSYALGGYGYGGIDCSGLTMRAYESVGIYITRSSYSYWGVGYGVSFSDLQPGDIVCYDSEWNGSIGHVAIYIGNGQVVHAMNEWRGVGVSSVYFGGYNILSVRRIIG